jgi:hypothetical protein
MPRSTCQASLIRHRFITGIPVGRHVE